MPSVHQLRESGRKRPQGFTLVELMVVIAITAILASLLLPALSAAKEKSRRAACGQNIRQVLMAAQMYASDNSEYFPSGKNEGGYSYTIRIAFQTYSNLVSSAGGQSKIFDCPNVVYGNESKTNWEGVLLGYCYLGDRLEDTQGPQGPEVLTSPKRATDPSTNALVADANYYGIEPTTSASLKLAPHGQNGSVLQGESSFTRGLPGSTSVDLGAKGGNVGLLDGSVHWKFIKNMKSYPASSDGRFRMHR